jgi:hypothetical protein
MYLSSYDINVPVNRVVTGGSGEYLATRGEQEQELLGMTDAMGVNLRVTFRLNQ